MLLKTFTAPSTSEAMQRVRAVMGDDAIIGSTRRTKGLVRITAALDAPCSEGAAAQSKTRSWETGGAPAILDALVYHGTPKRLCERLVHGAAALGAGDPVMAFAGALDAHFGFQPLSAEGDGRPIMLVGPPGAGKTVTAAKLAARTILGGGTVGVITTDTERAGGVDQLAAFTRILEVDLQTADTPDAVNRAVTACGEAMPVYVDTPGTNPFSRTEMGRLEDLIGASGAEPILVLAAGADAFEAADTAQSFAAVGATRLLVTRLDMARRVGGMLTACDVAGLKFSDVSITPYVAEGLSPINPVSLARLMVLQDDAGGSVVYEAA